MGIYVARAFRGTRDINQGDLLRNFPLPAAPIGENLILVTQGPDKKRVIKFKPDPDIVKKHDGQLRVCLKLNWELALVISNSCDIANGEIIHLAPVRPHKFVRAGVDPVEQWKEVSAAATGTATPKLFYLPGAPEYGLTRSEGLLDEGTPVTHSFVEHCLTHAGTEFVCGLTPEAQRHLQWQIGLVYGRDPREDDEWPSNEDLSLKLKMIEHEIGVARQRKNEEREAALRQQYREIATKIGAPGEPVLDLPRANQQEPGTAPVAGSGPPDAGAQ